MRKTTEDAITKRVHVSRLACGVTCGEFGIACYDRHLYGFDLLSLVESDVPLGDGTVLDVTVRVVKRKKARRNPWLRGTR